MDGTRVMTLGRLGAATALQPQLRYNPMPGNRTATPGQFQALPRPTLQNGPHALGRIGRVVEVAGLGNLGKVRRMLGADLPVEQEALQQLQDNAEGMQQAEDPYVPPQPLPATQDRTAYQNAVRTWMKIGWYISPIASAASAYHGYKRNNQSLGWAAVWGLMGGLFPLATPAIGFAQGWGKRKPRR